MHQIQRIANSIAKFQHVLRPALESKGIIFDSGGSTAGNKISNIDNSGQVKLKNNYVVSITIPPHDIQQGIYQIEVFDGSGIPVNDSKKELYTADEIYSEIVYLERCL